MKPSPASTTTSAAVRATPHDVVELACLAPSVHNTQPWSWRVDGSSIELFADARRRLRVTDPSERNLVVSCGAALHHAQVAALGLGWQPTVTRTRGVDAFNQLARIELAQHVPTPAQRAALQTLRDRRTDRRRFTSWRIPDGRLEELAAVAEKWGVVANALTDPDQHWEVETLLAEAYRVQAADPRALQEHAAWVDHSSSDGVPADTVPDRPQIAPGRRSRFGVGFLEDADREIESNDGLVVLGSIEDDRLSWLRAGEALSALWLDATATGLGVVPLSQPIEVAQTRLALQRDVLTSLAVPHILLRIGWPSIRQAPLEPVPRRTMDDVMTLH